MKNKISKQRVVALVLQNAVGDEVVFPDLESTENPVKGDYATINGNAVDGEVLMPDGSI